MSREIKFRAWSNGAKRMMCFGRAGVTLTDTMLSHGEEWGMYQERNFETIKGLTP